MHVHNTPTPRSDHLAGRKSRSAYRVSALSETHQNGTLVMHRLPVVIWESPAPAKLSYVELARLHTLDSPATSQCSLLTFDLACSPRVRQVSLPIPKSVSTSTFQRI